jgi:N-methylhydantoinase B
MCTTIPVERDEVIRIYSGTGGGYGNAADRPREKVKADLKNGFISRDQAIEIYGYQPN